MRRAGSEERVVGDVAFRAEEFFKRFDGLEWEQQDFGNRINLLRFWVGQLARDFVFEELRYRPEHLADDESEVNSKLESNNFSLPINFEGPPRAPWGWAPKMDFGFVIRGSNRVK